MALDDFIRQMPKVELHVHLIGAVTPDLLLKLAQRNGISLPAATLDEMRSWFRFRDFSHFIETYITAASCIRTVEDLEEVAKDFLIRPGKTFATPSSPTRRTLTTVSRGSHSQTSLPRSIAPASGPMPHWESTRASSSIFRG